MEPIYVVSIISVIIILLLLFGTPLKPIQFIGQVIVKLLIGAVLLFFLNTIGNQFDIHVPINWITSAISGFLGIPGIAALTIIQLYIIPN
jgi:inhibitor of the pro-sigma K processing machinery